jgi:hypothetical protein
MQNVAPQKFTFIFLFLTLFANASQSDDIPGTRFDPMNQIMPLIFHSLS